MKKALLVVIGFVITVSLFSQNTIPGYKSNQKSFEKTVMNQGQNQLPYNSYQSMTQNVGISPDINWIKQAGGDGIDEGKDIITDNTGNCYVTGYFSGIINLGNNSYSSSCGTDAFIAKFNNAGTLLWFRQISGQIGTIVKGLGITLDGQGNIYITGFFNSPSITVGDTSLIKTGIEDMLIVKYNNQGAFLLASHYGVSGEIREGVKIATDTFGNIYILNGGSNYSSIGCQYFTKMNSNGGFDWEIVNGAHYKDLKVKNSMIYLTGYLNTETQFSVITLTGSASTYTPFVAKCNSTGTFIWARQGITTATGASYNIAHSIVIDSSNDIYISGRFRQDLAFDSIILAGGTQRYVPFLVKCNNDGDFLWARQGVFDYAAFVSTYYDPVNIACDSFNNIYLSCELKNDNLSFEQNSIGGKGWCFVKYNTSGNIQWVTKKDILLNSLYASVTNKILYTGKIMGNIIVTQYDLTLDPVWTVFSLGNSGIAKIVNLETDVAGNVYVYSYSDVPTNVFGSVTGNFIAKLNPGGELIWTVPLEGANLKTAYGNFITLDLNGNIEILIHFNSMLTVGNYSLANTESDEVISLAKIDTHGNVLWLKQIGNGSAAGYSITTDYSNNVIASGIYNGTYSIGPYTFIDNAGSQAFIVKYDPNGNLQWAERAGSDSLDGTVYITFVSTDSLNNIYLTGEITNRYISIGSYPLILDEYDGDVILAKFSADGNVQWAFAYGGDPTGGEYNRFWCWPTGIKTNAAGDSYIYGWTSKGSYYGSFFLQSAENCNFFITKISNSGTVYWANILAETGQGWHSMQMDIDKSGNCYVGGNIRSTISFENNLVTPQGKYDLFLARYDQGGSFEWAKIFSSNPDNLNVSYDQPNYLFAIAVYDSSNLYFGGNFQNDLQMDSIVLYSSNVNGFMVLLGTGIPAGNEIITSAGTLNSCEGNGVIPITVNTLNNVGSISLTLNYNNQVLTYTGYQNVDSVLLPGTLLINNNNDTIHIAWFSITPANFTGGALLELLFTGITGNSDLTWDTQSQGTCHYTDIFNQSIPSLFVNGSANIIPCPDLSGIVSYDNIPSTKMNNTTVVLIKDSTTISQTLTDSYGYYIFPDLTAGVYSLLASTAKPWGGVNAADALLILRHFAGLVTLTGIRNKGADVNASGFVNSSDALYTAKRFVGLVNSFPAGDFVFENAPIYITGSSNITYNFKALCFGDVDGTYMPPAKQEAEIQLLPFGEILAKDAIVNLPLIALQDFTTAALSLVLEYPGSKMEIQDVTSPFDGNLVFHSENSVLRVAWYSLTSATLFRGTEFLTIKVRLHEETDRISCTDFSIGDGSQFAGFDAQVLPQVKVGIPGIIKEGLSYFLGQNIPNPFSESTVIPFYLPEEARVTLTVTDLLGRELIVLEDGMMPAGSHHAIIGNKQLKPGIYLYQLATFANSGPHVLIKRMVIH